MMSYYSQSVDMDTVMMFVVGFLGGFSTFSTALNEVVSLIRQRRFTLALGYGIATVAVPLICVPPVSALRCLPIRRNFHVTRTVAE